MIAFGQAFAMTVRTAQTAYEKAQPAAQSVAETTSTFLRENKHAKAAAEQVRQRREYVPSIMPQPHVFCAVTTTAILISIGATQPA